LSVVSASFIAVLASSSLSGTQGALTVAALALAALALVGCVMLAAKLRGMRKAQKLVLGSEGERDVVAHAQQMESAFQMLQEYVTELAQRLDGRLGAAEGELQRTISHRSLVRYDAYNELSGRQSMSIAMLDDTKSGIVLSCIHHRDQARLYAKQLQDGRSELELSPEEAEAVRLALARPPAGGDVSRLSA
jgi:urocanate hydratase